MHGCRRGTEESNMNKSIGSTAIRGLAALVGGIVFGVAMEFRGALGSIWMRAVVAGVGAAAAVLVASVILGVSCERHQ